MRLVILVLVLLSQLFACGGGPTASEAAHSPGATLDVPDAEMLATYWPTPQPVVERMMELGKVSPGKIHFDLGSGDGRFVIAAANRGAESVGYEIDPELIARSRKNIHDAGLDSHARIEAGDLLEADFPRADVVTCFLTPESYPQVAPRLRERLRPGTRVVAYKFPIPDWEPVETISMEDADPEIPTHQIFLYVM